MLSEGQDSAGADRALSEVDSAVREHCQTGHSRVCLLSGSLSSSAFERSRDVASLIGGCAIMHSGKLCATLIHAMKLLNVKLTNLLNPATMPGQLCKSHFHSAAGQLVKLGRQAVHLRAGI